MMIHRSRRLSYMLLIVLSLVTTVTSVSWGQNGAINAATTPAPAITPNGVGSSDYVLILRDSSLVVWNIAQNKEVAFVSLPTQLSGALSENTPESTPRIIKVDVDRGLQHLYTIEARGRDERRLPTSTQLIQTDLKTQARTVLVDRPGLYNVVLSPDEQQMIVGYYEGEYAVSRRYSCILNLASGKCEAIDLGVGYNPGVWIDNISYVVLSPRGRQLYVVHSDTLQTEQLRIPESWFLYSAGVVPGTRTLIISARPRTDISQNPSPILTFDLDTQELKEFAYGVANADYISIEDWRFSPDGKYLLYGSLLQMALVEFQSGRLIAEFKGVLQVGWMPDSKHLIVSLGQEGESAIVELNAETGEVRNLAKKDRDFGILVLPQR